MTDPYERLVDLARREQRALSEGRVEELEALGMEGEAIVASLPPRAPASAEPALRRAAELQAQTATALIQGLSQIGAELGGLNQARHTVRGYGASAGSQRPTVVDRAG